MYRRANKQSCGPSALLMLKLVLKVVLGVASCLNGKDTTHRERSIPRKSAE